LEEYDFTIHYCSCKTISHAGFLSHKHKEDSREDDGKGEESVGHHQVDRANDKGRVQKLASRQKKLVVKKKARFPPENAKTKAKYTILMCSMSVHSIVRNNKHQLMHQK
jgi:hypothetical protein